MYTDTSLWTELADKIAVRDYVYFRCGSELLPKLYKTYKAAQDIDFKELPDSFVIKTNNGCGSNYIVRSKDSVDLESIRSDLAKWLKYPYGELTGQLHYSRIKPQILAEELMCQSNEPEETLTDYKFYCFNGIVRYCYVVMDRVFDQKHSHKRMMYDTHWNELPDAFVDGVAFGYTEKPLALNEMIEIAEKLSEGIPFVRVDLYEVDGAVRFGEMTFMPGMDPGFNEAFQEEMGSMIVLPEAIRNI